ncbi:hypothetical protein NPIL_271721 [Nephila pilipes]|uniref:Uncharacterized protein n=1 Tax=Nephila pilipes TaxID=299642 RepID=A0A8X6QZM5_NEPPI|nr:hypothetical protein NPIL_271721 [Nephila pilipes]
MDAAKRIEFVKERKICVNCLKSQVQINCFSKYSYPLCSKRHNSLQCRNTEEIKQVKCSSCANISQASAEGNEQTVDCSGREGESSPPLKSVSNQTKQGNKSV